MTSRLGVLLVPLLLAGCLAPPELSDVASVESSLTPAERRVRAGQIRDAAAANGITEGWLLAGIADAETRMSHCWSELTWACMGPASPDCGGGPVVAGAGDGPCSARQGGLGMFQFDAGTYDDTLRREGDRILTIAGNVAAAVDFVIAMVIRSAYVPGVSNRDEAVAWINGVRIGNDRWDPWIRTVTHYYNGCAPSYSCFTQRYGHYRDNTTGVYNEMGADFWATRVDFAAQWVSQSFPLARDAFELFPGQDAAGEIVLRNTGYAAWMPGVTNLGTTQPRDGASALAGPDWLSPSRAATVDRMVPPGETGTFRFTVRAPAAPGDYPQFFTLVQEGVAWFSDQGGPPDDQLQIRVTVLEPPPCPAGTGPDWACDGAARVRCVAGEVERATCEHGCAGGVCQDDPGMSGPIDRDGDGHADDVDCDDADPTVHPGAREVCDDGIDQNCDGFECHETEDGEIVERRIGTPLSSGCAAAPARSTPAWPLAALGALALVARRRRGR